MRCVGALSVLLWWCVSFHVSAPAWAHGGEDHSHPAAAPVAEIPASDRVSAQSGLIEAVLVANSGASTLDLYLSAQQSNAPLAGAEIDVSGLALAAPVQAISAGHYRLALSTPLPNEPQLLALTISATVGTEDVLELLDLTLTPSGAAGSEAQHQSPNTASSWTSRLIDPDRGLVSGLVVGLLTGLAVCLLPALRRTRLFKAGV